MYKLTATNKEVKTWWRRKYGKANVYIVAYALNKRSNASKLVKFEVELDVTKKIKSYEKRSMLKERIEGKAPTLKEVIRIF